MTNLNSDKHVIDPDGVEIKVAWDLFKIGSSVFIPCINTARAKKQVRKITDNMGYDVKMTARAENHKWGVRIWRTL